MKLFMVYLGGSAPGANIELHDIQFVVGKTIEDTFAQLRKNWFGDPQGLHMDSYKEIRGADGYKVELKEHAQNSANKLYFVNLGGYQKHTLSEFHEFGVFVAKNAEQAKNKAMASLLNGAELKHKDDLLDVANFIIKDKVQGHFVHLSATDKIYKLTPDWFGYRVISG